MKKFFGILFLITAFGTVLFFAFKVYSNFNHSKPKELKRLSVASVLKNIVELAVLEVEIAQLHEMSSEGLKIQSFSIPFTGQKILVLTKGEVKLGFDLDNLRASNINLESVSQESLYPFIKVLSLDLKHEFVHESDSLVNRIGVGDRNKLLKEIRKEIESSYPKKKHLNHISKRFIETLKQFEYQSMP